MEAGPKNFNPFIEGDRVYLREVRPSDVAEGYYFWMNDPEVTEFLEVRFTPQSTERIEAYVKEMEKNADNVFLAIVAKDRLHHIGNIKLGPINWYHRFSSLSLVIGEKDFWGKGYGTESIGLAIAYAFDTLNLHKITAGIYADNTGSIRAFQKAGFKEEGRRKKHRFYKGRYADEVLMGCIRPE